MKVIMMFACLVALSGWADDKAPKLLDRKDSSMSMSAHEIKGIDRKSLSVVTDDEDGSELSLSGIDGTRTEWREKIERTTEEMSWW